MTQPMPATRRQHWAQISEFGSVAGMRLLFWTCRILGRWPFRIVLYPVLLWYMKVLAGSSPVGSPYCAILRHSPRICLTKCCCGADCSKPIVLSSTVRN